MKSMIEAFQSYLCLDRKPLNNNNKKKQKGFVGDGGHGGYGFNSLLNKRSKPKREPGDGDKLSRKVSSSRVHSLISISNMVSSELSSLPLPPPPPPPPPPPSKPILERIKSRKSSMNLRGCLGKMYNRRGKAWKHVGNSFDKCTSEYYSRSKKLGLNARRLASDLAQEIGNVDDFDEDHHLNSWTCPDTEVSDSPEEVRACVEDELGCNEAGPSHREIPNESNGKSTAFAFGSSLKKRPNERGEPVFGSSPARGIQHKRTFPPPLTSLAMHSYCDRRGQSPPGLACSTTYCLRSLRKDGRFMLEEVKAPTQKYFKVLREDGRLKLELVNLAGDSSQEEDEPYTLDVCTSTETGSRDVCGPNHALGLEKSSCAGLCIGEGDIVEPKGKVEVDTDDPSTSKFVGDYGVSTELLEPSKYVPPAAGNDAKPMRTSNMVLSTGVVFENVDGPSSGRTSMRAFHSGPSSTVKNSWARPISAF